MRLLSGQFDARYVGNLGKCSAWNIARAVNRNGTYLPRFGHDVMGALDAIKGPSVALEF